MYIPEETIREVRESSDILGVVSQYVELRRAGSNFKALCPFHQEKTPSFMVSPEKQIFHCFGCGRGGNVFVFLMEMEGITFPEAVRSLASRCGVPIPERSGRKEDKSRNQALYEANEFAAEFYHKFLLKKPRAEKARRYLRARDIKEDSWREFRLGFAPDSWDLFCKEAGRAGITLSALKELKLVVARTRGGYYDYFRNRILFPVVSLSGRVIAFGGRVLKEGEDPKYLNSAESPIFAKRRVFFGLNKARPAIREAKEAVLVEGYTDCISLHQVGILNTIASCGTAVSPEHASILRKLTSSVILLPDGDQAGQMAAVFAGACLTASGLNVRVCSLPEGRDPDCIARDMGKGIASLIREKAMDYFAFLNYIIKVRTLPLHAREDLLGKVLEGVSSGGDRLRVEMILKELSLVFSVDVEILRERMHRAIKYRRRGDGAGKKPMGEPGDKRVELEKVLLRLMMEAGAPTEEARSKLDLDDFYQENSRQLYKVLDSALEKHIDLESREFQELAEKAGVAGLAAEIAFISIPPGDIALLLKDYVKRIKELRIRDELKVLSEKLRTLPEESEEAVAVAEYYKRLRMALSQL